MATCGQHCGSRQWRDLGGDRVGLPGCERKRAASQASSRAREQHVQRLWMGSMASRPGKAGRLGICSVARPLRLWRSEEWRGRGFRSGLHTQGAVLWAEMEPEELIIIPTICMLTTCQDLSPHVPWRAKMPEEPLHDRGLPFSQMSGLECSFH